MKIILRNGKIVLPSKVFLGDIQIEDGKITKIGEKLSKDDSCCVIDVSGKYVTPGFIDIHTHGGYGSDFMDSNRNDFVNALKFHTDNGTTTVVPTSCTAPKTEILKFLDTYI